MLSRKKNASQTDEGGCQRRQETAQGSEWTPGVMAGKPSWTLRFCDSSSVSQTVTCTSSVAGTQAELFTAIPPEMTDSRICLQLLQ